jgi:DeoR family fructose operon transcriptional repressor
MFPAQRIEVLKRILQEKKSVDISTLSVALEVSDVTVRKYLDKLEEEGFLTKMHGGAILKEDYNEPDDTDELELINGYDAKDQIATLVGSLIDDGDSIFLGPGTTCYLLAKRLIKTRNVTLVTNNVNALEIMAPYVKNLCFIGGEIVYKDGLMYTYGQKALSQLDGMFVQKAFISVEGVDLKAGLTVNDINTQEIFKKVESISKTVIIMADHNKFNKVGLHHFAPLDRFKIYVTSEKVDDKYKEYFFINDIKILTAYNI